RRVVAPRARSRFRSGSAASDVHGYHPSSAAQPSQGAAGQRQERARAQGEHLMKASRLTAVGLVAAAGLWIASGHFLPPAATESRAAPGEAAAGQPFRVAVTGTSVVPHRRTLVISGRTEADKRVTVVARGGGVVTELKVRRGAWVEKGDVIAVLSDEAR